MLRREFLKTIPVLGATSFINPFRIIAHQRYPAAKYFSLHPFIEAHPEAVFIKKTSVDVKTNSAKKLQTGLDFAKEIFTMSDTAGIPLTNKLIIKPNLTLTSGTGGTAAGMGIITDKDFTEGFINGMKEAGFINGNMFMREGNMLADGYCNQDYAVTGYTDMAQRVGVNLTDFPTGRKIYEAKSDTLQSDSEVIWKACPNGVVFKRIGFISPVNQAETWLLNISKFKTHGMGMTLCVKNLQGMCVYPYIRFCNSVDDIKAYPAAALADFQNDFEQHVTQLYQNHLSAQVPRWDKPGAVFPSGFAMELWAQRTCDSHSVASSGLSIIEGIYGRNGNGFVDGPGPDGKAEDFMTNILVFGKNAFLVDIIGTWLAGHEPGNFGLFHIGYERGFIKTFNPKDIPVYAWDKNTPVLKSLTDFERTPLKTIYLCKDYNGQTEDVYHMVNEPFNYPIGIINNKKKPSFSFLANIYPGNQRIKALVEYTMPVDGYASLDVFTASGQRAAILQNSWVRKGTHLAQWNTSNTASGAYYIVFRTNGYAETKKMTLLR